MGIVRKQYPKCHSRHFFIYASARSLEWGLFGHCARSAFQALEMNPMTMQNWIEALDNQILSHRRKILMGKGNISHQQAIEKAEKEFEIYRQCEMQLLESDFDREIKKLKEK